MPTYIVLGQFTEQGIKNVKDTTKRAQGLKDMGKKLGATVQATYWTMGQYDTVAIIDAPDDASMNALLLSVGALGNVRTHTMRALTSDEMSQVLARL